MSADDVGPVGSRFRPLRRVVPNHLEWNGVWVYVDEDLRDTFAVEPDQIKVADNATAQTELNDLRPLGFKILSHTDKRLTCQRLGRGQHVRVDVEAAFFHELVTSR